SFDALGLPPCTFTLAPSMELKPRYELLLESGPHVGRAQQLSRLVQKQLENINLEYMEKCKSGRIDPVAVHEINPGTWAALRSARSRERGNYEEFKQPCLVGDLNFIDDLPTPTASVAAGRAAS
ncbi:MAG: hypothetical protein ACR2NU_00845, partial [Aeoliella sp.]